MIYDNTEVLLGKVKYIKEYAKKMFENWEIDSTKYIDIMELLEDYNNDDIATIDYSNDMGYRIERWKKEDKVNEIW